MAQDLAVGDRVGSTATRHLIHRPKSTVHFLLDSRCTQEERFALAGDMPSDHPLFNDGLGQVHDPLMFVEIARHVGAFIGRRYFRVPLDRDCRFNSIEFALTTPAAWRVGESHAHMAMDIYAAPAPTINGIQGLRLRGMMEIDGIAGCTGHADLSFLTPDVHRHRRTASRPWAGARDLGYGRTPADPQTVGRRDARNVVVSAPVGTDDALSTQLLVDSQHPLFFPESSEVVPAILLVEAIRQTSMLTASRTRGFSALHTCVTHASVHFPGNAALDAPLTCTAEAHPIAGSSEENSSARIRLKIDQLDRVVAEAEVTLAHAI